MKKNSVGPTSSFSTSSFIIMPSTRHTIRLSSHQTFKYEIVPKNMRKMRCDVKTRKQIGLGKTLYYMLPFHPHFISFHIFFIVSIISTVASHSEHFHLRFSLRAALVLWAQHAKNERNGASGRHTGAGWMPHMKRMRWVIVRMHWFQPANCAFFRRKRQVVYFRLFFWFVFLFFSSILFGKV